MQTKYACQTVDGFIGLLCNPLFPLKNAAPNGTTRQPSCAAKTSSNQQVPTTFAAALAATIRDAISAATVSSVQNGCRTLVATSRPTTTGISSAATRGSSRLQLATSVATASCTTLAHRYVVRVSSTRRVRRLMLVAAHRRITREEVGFAVVTSYMYKDPLTTAAVAGRCTTPRSTCVAMTLSTLKVDNAVAASPTINATSCAV